MNTKEITAPLSEVIAAIKTKFSNSNEIEFTKGLFQLNNSVGLLFPIIKDENGNLHMSSVSCKNNDGGQVEACQIMDAENFVEWAIDPWTGEINIEIE